MVYSLYGLIWKKELEILISSFNSFTPNLKLTYESNKKDISFSIIRLLVTISA